MNSEAAVFDPSALVDAGDFVSPIHQNEPNHTGVADPVHYLPLIEVSVATDGLDDETLLGRLSDSDQEALAVLFRRFARGVRSVGLRILRSEPEADDLVQDVFLFLYQKASAFNPSRGSARTWILLIAYNRALDRRKYLNSRHFYTSQVLEEESFRGSDGSSERSLEGSSLLEEMLGRDLAAKLPQQLSMDQLETIRLHLSDGHSLREIAEIMGQSLVNVRNFYYRGLERIRKTILPAMTRSK
jgi:RNA polymerase sigma-70 factor (ECF subfamily)